MSDLSPTLIPPASSTSSLVLQQATANAPSLEDLSEPVANIPPPYSPFPQSVTTHYLPETLTTSFTWKVTQGKRLGHMDFVPRVVQKRILKEDLYDTQTDLINRVNCWLEDHPGLEVITCETVTWFANQYKDIYSDVIVCSRVSDMFSKTTYIRGIRLWFITDIIPKSNIDLSKLQTIQCETFLPKIKESFSQLIDRVNQAIVKQSCRIMKIEMVKLMVKDGMVSVEATHWEERYMEDVMFVWCVRVYSCLCEDNNKEVIGYQDFIPECLRKSRENGGYEVFSDVLDKVSRWLAQQQLIRPCNIQCVSMKMKKSPHFEDRCKFTQRSSNQSPFLSIIRVFYLVPKQKVESTNILPVRLSCKTFVPIINDGKVQRNFESVKLLVERINQWLVTSGANLAGVETSSMTLIRDFKVPLLGSECTFQFFPPEKESLKQLFFIRIYLDGEYNDLTSSSPIVFSPSPPIHLGSSSSSTSFQSPIRFL